MNCALYYENVAKQGAAIFRSISHGHMFNDGNKRTAVGAFQYFAEHFYIKNCWVSRNDKYSRKSYNR
ncbi:Fic family protein [Empedobacter brevis]